MLSKISKMDVWTYLYLSMIFIGSVGGILFSVKQLISAKNTKEQIIASLESNNKQLKEELKISDSIIQEQQLKLEDKTTKVLEFQLLIRTNTLSIENLSKEIKELATSNNKVSKAIQNEQKEKGEIKLNIEPSDYYYVHLGQNMEYISKEQLTKGYQLGRLFPQAGPLPIVIKLQNSSILISSVIRDEKNELVVELEKGMWALSKSNNFSINYDKHGLEIIDKKGLVMFQIDLHRNHLYIKGLFYLKDFAIVFDDQTLVTGYNGNYIKEIYSRASRIERMFLHHGVEYLGNRTNEFKINRRLQIREEERIESNVRKTTHLYLRKEHSEILELTKQLVEDLNELIKKEEEFSSKIRKMKDQRENEDYYKALNEKNEKDIIKEYNQNFLIESISLRNVMLEKSKNYGKPLMPLIEYTNLLSIHSLSNIIREIKDLANSLK